MRMTSGLVVITLAGLAGCASVQDRDTLADLRTVEPELDDVQVADSLERAEQSYRRYLEETPSTAMTPEAMRRLADLQIEQEFGVIGSGELVEVSAEQAMEPPVRAARPQGPSGDDNGQAAEGLRVAEYSESREEFEQRASAEFRLDGADAGTTTALPEGMDETALAGPLEAIRTYQQILDEYPDYERNDQVLYQMSRAYDELGRSDDAMEVMQRFVTAYPDSRYIDEVYFRRGEYFFVRKQYLDAEASYGSIINMGEGSPYYELALYKLGWTFYKQSLFEEALHRYMAMLDHRLSNGYDFDLAFDDEKGDDDHRIADTFRVISLSFSNLGGPEVIDEYFADYGTRSYGDRIYSNLGEFYLEKLRYQDAAAVYGSFIELNPYHRVAPHFSMRVVEIYGEGEFPRLVVEAKKEFAERYSLQADYWQRYDPRESPEVMGFLKTNLKDLANHYHALYQQEDLVDDQPENYREALTWYRQFLSSFPEDDDSPPINYQLADLLLENEDFARAAVEYERTAYEYPAHEKSAAAGYAAVYAHRQDLERASGADRIAAKSRTVESSLRFADTFPDHEKSPTVLGAAADDLYAMEDYERAIVAGQTVIERYPDSEQSLRRSAWIVVAHSSMDINEFAQAENAYARVLELTGQEDESRPALIDGLAAAIYKQGEQANLLEDYRAAADHFLRVKAVAPTSTIRTAAEYDAAAALVKLEDWTSAAGVLEEFRVSHAEHELADDATKQLALIYREDGQLGRSAAEHVRIADETGDPELARDALLVGADLYEEAGQLDSALGVYERYVADYPDPLDVALETRNRIAEIYRDKGDLFRYHEELREIVARDAEGGDARTERTRYLAARGGLVLAELTFESFAALELVQPFEQSLANKQARMDDAMAEFEALVAYEVAEVTAAATFYIAEIYYEFSDAIVNSERPTNLSASELADYEMVLEEEAYAFEEQAIEIHEENFELLAMGVYNDWVQQSLDQLAVLMPGRYAKNEISSGFLGSIDVYAYRMPIAPELPEQPGLEAPGEGLELPEAEVQVTRVSPER
ncbi:MAG: tetratricopeptide repeat protein [Gammaproteobacteria bacterium]